MESFSQVLNYIYVRWSEGLGSTCGLTILLPLFWSALPAWGKVIAYVATVLFAMLVFTGATANKCAVLYQQYANPVDLANAIGLALLTGPLIAWGIRMAHHRVTSAR